MTKLIKIFGIFLLLAFSFFAGVRYSNDVKNHVGWLLENKDDEVELPDLSNDNSENIGATVDENGDSVGEMENDQTTQPISMPSDNIDETNADSVNYNTSPQTPVTAPNPTTTHKK